MSWAWIGSGGLMMMRTAATKAVLEDIRPSPYGWAWSLRSGSGRCVGASRGGERGEVNCRLENTPVPTRLQYNRGQKPVRFHNGCFSKSHRHTNGDKPRWTFMLQAAAHRTLQ